eukprot:11694534-Alexandrium_andersonii.AAC.1
MCIRDSFSGWDKSKANDYYLQQACRIFSAYTGALLVHTQESVPVIRLRNTPDLPSWATGCSNFLFVLPLPTESGGYCSGLVWHKAAWTGKGSDDADHRE